MKNRSVQVVILAVLSLLLLGPIPNSLARPPGTQPVSRTALPKALDVPEISAAYGTGTAIHADAVRAGQNSLVGLDVSFSGAAFSSAPLASEVVNEVRRTVAPKLNLNNAFGRGTGLELGIANEPQALIGQLSQALAPGTKGLVHKVIGPIGIPPILRAELLRSQAEAHAIDGGCALGPDQGYGLGSVLDLEVLGGLIATEARPPYREVVQSSSTTRIVKGSTAGRLGLQSETRQTIAPVTLFKGTPFQFTIEVLGEWVLRAVADGAKGSIHYGPLAKSPETPIVRILDAKGFVIGQLTTQMLLGNQGLVITIPDVAEIAVGEDPRAIGGDAASAPTVDATAAAAAVDVVRVRLFKGDLADVRVGHMEAAVTVPKDGVQCPGLKLKHEVDKPSVTPGEDFLYTITITNPNDCVLDKLKLVETPSGDPAGVKYELVEVKPSVLADLAGGKATFANLGPLGPGESKTITVKVKVPAGSTAGTLRALAVADAVCPAVQQPTTKTAEPPDDIPLSAKEPVEGPTVGICVVPDVVGKDFAAASTLIKAAGCIIGDVTEKTGQPPGQVVDQGPNKPGDEVPIGTPIDLGVNGPFCDVPSVVNTLPEDAKKALEAKGCKLGDQVEDKTAKPEDAGKITSQDPPAGDKVPVGSEVDVTVAPRGCTVPNVVGLDEAAAKDALEKAGCRLGDVKPGADNLEQAGKVTEQDKPSGSLQPAGTDVDITIAGPVCVVPNLVGMSEADARSAVEAQGCTLTTDQRATSNPSDVGKVLAQNPTANLHVKKGSPVNVSLGVQVLGETAIRGQSQDAGSGPTLVRTGGVALGGLALWLLLSGLGVQLAGSNRLWRLIRRQRG